MDLINIHYYGNGVKNVRRVDKCSLNEIEKYMEDNVNHIKECKTTNYYVVYRDKLDETNSVFKYEVDL